VRERARRLKHTIGSGGPKKHTSPPSPPHPTAQTWPKDPISVLRSSLQAQDALHSSDSPRRPTPSPSPSRFLVPKYRTLGSRQLAAEARRQTLRGSRGQPVRPQLRRAVPQGAPRRPAAERQRRRGAAAGGHSGLGIDSIPTHSAPSSVLPYPLRDQHRQHLSC